MFEFHFLKFKKQQDVINLFLFSTTIKTSNKSKDSGGIKKKNVVKKYCVFLFLFKFSFFK